MNHINNWKNKSVFLKQLDLNKQELNNNYPQHWYSFINLVNSLREDISLLDIGCGVGSYYELCKRHCEKVNYTGMDYSIDAINIAKDEWDHNGFFVLDVNDINQSLLSKYNMIHMGALLDVLPNADNILDFVLKFGVEYVLISRIEISNNSECSTYKAYDEITTYRYKHGKDKLLEIIKNNNYDIFSTDGNNLLLKKIRN